VSSKRKSKAQLLAEHIGYRQVGLLACRMDSDNRAALHNLRAPNLGGLPGA
jgi:hypothetical protein